MISSVRSGIFLNFEMDENMLNSFRMFLAKTVFTGLTLLLFSISSMADTDVYITRDANGNQVFSDTPSSNSEKKVIREIQTIPETKIDTISIPDSNSKIKELPKYKEISISSPANDEAIRENSGLLNVTVSLEPGLRGKDQIILYMDGKEVAKGSSTSFALPSVDRGTHVLVAAIVSEEGEEQIRSEPVTVHLLRVSTQSKSTAPQPVAVVPPASPPTP